MCFNADEIVFSKIGIIINSDWRFWFKFTRQKQSVQFMAKIIIVLLVLSINLDTAGSVSNRQQICTSYKFFSLKELKTYPSHGMGRCGLRKGTGKRDENAQEKPEIRINYLYVIWFKHVIICAREWIQFAILKLS